MLINNIDEPISGRAHIWCFWGQAKGEHGLQVMKHGRAAYSLTECMNIEDVECQDWIV